MFGEFNYDEFGDCIISLSPEVLEEHFLIENIAKFIDFEIFGGLIEKNGVYKIKILLSRMSPEAKDHSKKIKKIFDLKDIR